MKRKLDGGRRVLSISVTQEFANQTKEMSEKLGVSVSVYMMGAVEWLNKELSVRFEEVEKQNGYKG